MAVLIGGGVVDISGLVGGMRQADGNGGRRGFYRSREIVVDGGVLWTGWLLAFSKVIMGFRQMDEHIGAFKLDLLQKRSTKTTNRQYQSSPSILIIPHLQLDHYPPPIP